jgi:hypothetical protein
MKEEEPSLALKRLISYELGQCLVGTTCKLLMI